MKLNVKLLRQIQKHIKAEPKRYDQSTWGIYLHKAEREEWHPPCGTQACIAGWAVVLNQPEVVPERLLRSRVSFKAQQILGLTNIEADQLFSPYNQKHSRGAAGVREACKKIDQLIANRRKRA